MVKKNLAPGTIETDSLQSEQRLNIQMGEPGIFARNLRLLTAMRELTAERACKEIAEMMRREAVAERDRILKNTSDSKASQAATEKFQEIAKIKIDPKWYRRLMASGVSRSDKRTRTQFHAIARFFEVRYEGLWETDLVTFKLNDLKAPIVTSTQTRFAFHVQKLIELLDHEAGKYDYLKSLLDSLYAEATRSSLDEHPTPTIKGRTLKDFMRRKTSDDRVVE